MDFQLQHRKLLETVQEESEEEDEIERSETGEREEEEEEFHFQEGVESEEVMAQEESEEDEDDAPRLRVLRPKRMSRYLRQESSPQTQSTNNPQEEMENFSESDQMTLAGDLSDDATPPRQERLGYERRSSSDGLRRKFHFSKIRRQKSKTPEASEQKKTNRRRSPRTPPVVEPFPDWLVSLMVNIEEATTHQLVVE